MSAVGDARKRRQEEGRRLASERDDLIAAGVDPADLLIPIGSAFAVPMSMLDGRPWVPTEVEADAGAPDQWAVDRLTAALADAERQARELREGIEALATKWDRDRLTYPTSSSAEARYSEVAVRLCGEELRALLTDLLDPGEEQR